MSPRIRGSTFATPAHRHFLVERQVGTGNAGLGIASLNSLGDPLRAWCLPVDSPARVALAVPVSSVVIPPIRDRIGGPSVCAQGDRGRSFPRDAPGDDLFPHRVERNVAKEEMFASLIAKKPSDAIALTAICSS